MFLDGDWENYGAGEAADYEGGAEEACLYRREAKRLGQEVYDGAKTYVRAAKDRENYENIEEVFVREEFWQGLQDRFSRICLLRILLCALRGVGQGTFPIQKEHWQANEGRGPRHHPHEVF